MKVSNVSLGASERDIKEFFSFSGDIVYLEMHRLLLNILLSLVICFLVQMIGDLICEFPVVPWLFPYA